jgi:hypothetical protein
MPRRPLPILPRGPRRRRPVPETILFACPRVAPDWELGALRALMKPQTRGFIAHRRALQPWSPTSRRVVQDCVDALRERLGLQVEPHFPIDGDYAFACEIAHVEVEKAKALALLASARLPKLWFVLGRLYLKDGKFHRRARGFKLNIVPATNVHLTRPIRAALRDVLKPM